MRQSRRTLLMGGLALLAGCALPPAAPLVPPRVVLVDLRPRGLGLLAQELEAQVALENPNTVPLRLRGLRLSLWVDEQFLGSGSRRLELEVAPLARRRLALSLLVPTGVLLERVLAALQRGGFRYRLEGVVLVAAAGGLERLAVAEEAAFAAPAPWPRPR